MYYLIKQTLEKTTLEEIKESDVQYVAVLSFEEWKLSNTVFDMGIDLDFDELDLFTTKAEVNYDSLTGTFVIPDRENISGTDSRFAFALDEKGIVFIDNSGASESLVRKIQISKKWRMPGLERFIYDLLDQIVKDDLRLMEKYDAELNAMEQAILNETDHDRADGSDHYFSAVDTDCRVVRDEFSIYA